jgi:MtrB/PioB family decaheme-associated outer membrane protein
MIHKSFVTLVAFLLPLMVFAGVATAETTARGGDIAATGLLNVGVQQTNVRGSSEKFEEYRDVKDGFLVNAAAVRVEQDSSRYFIDVKIKNPLQENEFYSVTGGKHGRFKYNFFFDSIPHNFTNGVLLFNGVGGNRLFIADNVQNSLQSVEQTRPERGGNPLVDTTGEDAATQAIVRGLYAEADPVTFRLKREKAGFSFEYNLTPDVKTFARVTNEQRNGIRVITAGTYERFAQGAAGITHTADLFIVRGADLAEPIDFRTTTVTLGAGIYKKSWLADLEYSFTNFDNHNAALIWDNPFRITDNTATNAAGAALVAGDNGFDRGRFARGQLSLSPDSRAHDVTVSGAADLPLHSRFSGSASYGWITQDSPFVPYTLNSAINNLAFAGAPAALGIDVTNPAFLPQRDLNGEVGTLAGSFNLTSKPTRSVKTTLKYRYYDYDNKSDEIHFPGYAGFGESYWRLFKNDVSGPNDAPVVNEPLSYTKQVADLSVDFHVATSLTLIAEAGWEGWEFEKLRVDSSDEYFVGAAAIYRPGKTASLKVAYKYAVKDVDGYLPGDTAANPEAPGLVNYNWADRKRHKADARFQYDPFDSLSLGISALYRNDRLGGDSRFGLKKVEDAAGALDVAYTPAERLTLLVTYARDYRKSRMQSGSKDDAFDIPSTADNEALLFGAFNPVNYWNTDMKETTDTVGVSVKLQIVPNRLTLDTGYNLSYSKADFDTSNPNAALSVANFGTAAKLSNAVAQPWPTVVNRLHEIRANLAYKWFANLTVGATYLFEWYKLNDFAWDNLQPYMAGLSAENSTQFVFAGATYKEYEAHVGQVYLAYKF